MYAPELFNINILETTKETKIGNKISKKQLSFEDKIVSAQILRECDSRFWPDGIQI